MKTVIVGMSGGVDSSVSALLLKEQGYNVIGMFMKNWQETSPDGHCTAEQDYLDALAVAEKIGIPLYTINLSKTYWDEVFQRFVEEYKLGYTPNPDILCNKEVKFKAFLQKALDRGADMIATGHYCQVETINNRYFLKEGADPNKDQTYFLHAVTEEALKKTLFPIGHLPKSEVRKIAKENNLLTASKRDSTGICFIGKRPFQEFLSQYIKPKPGVIETVDGKVIGKHDGAWFYTIGQRKGLGIGGEGAPWFVVDKDIDRNVVIVAQGQDHPSLYHNKVVATELNWITSPLNKNDRCYAKIRYRTPKAPCTITTIENDKIEVIFDEPQRGITPRQSIVFYQGDKCLGGALIAQRSNS